MSRKVPVVALNYKAEVKGYFESTRQAARVCGFSSSAISESVTKGYTVHCFRFVTELEYMKRYQDGTLDELRFGTKKERMTARSKKSWETMSDETKARRTEKLREYKKEWMKSESGDKWRMVGIMKRKPVRCLDTDELFESVNEAAKSVGSKPTCLIRKMRKGLRFKGLMFVYENKDKHRNSPTYK